MKFLLCQDFQLERMANKLFCYLAQVSRQRASEVKKPPIDEMFNDVYDQLPPHLQRQRKELWEHIKRYEEHYPLDRHEQS